MVTDFVSINRMKDAKKMALAYEIADALNDRKSIDQHIGYAHRFSEEFLREQLEYVLSKPAGEIEKSRAAYFVYLVKRGGYKSWN